MVWRIVYRQGSQVCYIYKGSQVRYIYRIVSGMERIKARTENESNGIFGNIDQRQSLLHLVEKFVPVVSDIQIVFSEKGKTGLLTTDEFRHGLPSEKLEAVINNPPMLDKAKRTVLKLVRNFITRNTILRSFFIAVRNRWNRIRS